MKGLLSMLRLLHDRSLSITYSWNACSRESSVIFSFLSSRATDTSPYRRSIVSSGIKAIQRGFLSFTLLEEFYWNFVMTQGRRRYLVFIISNWRFFIGRTILTALIIKNFIIDSRYLRDNLIIFLLKKNTENAKERLLAAPKMSEVFIGGVSYLRYIVR